MAIPTREQFVQTARDRLADTEDLARRFRAEGEEAMAKQADKIAAKWRDMIVKAGGKVDA